MKQIILFILVTCALQSNAQTSDTIYWSPCYKLKFEDFKGTPDTTKIDLANSRIGIWYTYKIINGKPEFNVICYFLKGISWTKYNMPTIFEHEQIHFDIAKLFAQKLEQKLREYKLTPNIAYDTRKIYDSIVAERLLMDNLLDAKIKGAINDTPQKKFMISVRKQLPICKKKG
jgi:hypothetical protein